MDCALFGYVLKFLLSMDKEELHLEPYAVYWVVIDTCIILT